MTFGPRSKQRRSLVSTPFCETLESRTLLSFAAGTPAAASNASYDSVIHASDVRGAYNVDGSGLAAAVIDTGIDYLNPSLGGGYGAGYPVSGGFDLAMNDADPRAETWSHGTNVSGLIASRSTEAPGVAPGANLIALRVFGNNNLGDFSTIADALQWVVDHHDEYHITVVNLSVSDGGNYVRDWYSTDARIGQRISGLIDRLNQLRIPVVAASGNSFNGTQGMGFVAIIPGTISVTASVPGDQLMSNAQRLGRTAGGNSATDLAAPGAELLTTGENGGLTRVGGTSFAAPLVTGAIVLLQQIYQARFGAMPTVSDLNRWLKDGADLIVDQATGITLGRLNVARSASLIPGPMLNPPPVTTVPTTPVVTPPASTPTTPSHVIVNITVDSGIQPAASQATLSDLYATRTAILAAFSRAKNHSDGDLKLPRPRNRRTTRLAEIARLSRRAALVLNDETR
jgi:type VI secretion system secreted protein VgrG